MPKIHVRVILAYILGATRGYRWYPTTPNASLKLRATGNRHLADAHVADRWCQKPPAYALIL